MPGCRCTVAACNNSKQRAKKLGKNISFHRFPKDKELCQIWIEKCRRIGKWNPESCHICSDHFTADDYERDLKAELLQIPCRQKLKSTAIPSLKLYTPSKGKNIVTDQIINEEENSKIKLNGVEASDDIFPGPSFSTVKIEPIDFESTQAEQLSKPSLKEKYKTLKRKYKVLENDHKILKSQLEAKEDEILQKELKITALEKMLFETRPPFLDENSYMFMVAQNGRCMFRLTD